MAKTVPRVAPDDAPMTKGSARGLWNGSWQAYPLSVGQHSRAAVVEVGQNRDLGPVDGGDVGRSDDLLRTASVKDPTLAQQEDLVAELGRQV
jgi:hypothetical protein